jgi:hypothetical protein
LDSSGKKLLPMTYPGNTGFDSQGEQRLTSANVTTSQINRLPLMSWKRCKSKKKLETPLIIKSSDSNSLSIVSCGGSKRNLSYQIQHQSLLNQLTIGKVRIFILSKLIQHSLKFLKVITINAYGKKLKV